MEDLDSIQLLEPTKVQANDIGKPPSPISFTLCTIKDDGVPRSPNRPSHHDKDFNKPSVRSPASSLNEFVMYILRVYPMDVQKLPSPLHLLTLEEEMIDVLSHTVVTHDAIWSTLNL